MFVGVRLRGFTRMVHRILLVSVRRLCVVRGLLVIARFVLLRRLLVMARRLLMMFGCLAVMLGGLFRHGAGSPLGSYDSNDLATIADHRPPRT